MKLRGVLIVGIGFVLGSVGMSAAQHRYFKVTRDLEWRASPVCSTNLPLAPTPNRILIEVSAEDWGKGTEEDWDNLPESVKTNGLALALESAADVGRWTIRERAIVKGFQDLLNERLPPDKQISNAELKAAIRARLVQQSGG